MDNSKLPAQEEMFSAFESRDDSYEGIFFTAVKTTGIFCRPTCPARKPKRENVEFFANAALAMAHGYRPCKRCSPLEPSGSAPPGVRRLLNDIEADPMTRLRDEDLRARGLDPVGLRRWFKRHHGVTFQAYHRARRLAIAMNHLAGGKSVTDTAFDSGFESTSGFQEALRKITRRSARTSRHMPVVHLTRYLSPLGPMIIGTTDQGVCLLEFSDRRMLETQLGRLVQRLNCVFMPGRDQHGQQLEQELDAYFQGQSWIFSTPLMMAGSDFQIQVWNTLREIPPGQTVSYGEQARRMGRPSAVRAVARANGDNPLAIIVPCHRVVGANGTLTGYGGGLWRKRWLLDHEQCPEQISDRSPPGPG